MPCRGTGVFWFWVSFFLFSVLGIKIVEHVEGFCDWNTSCNQTLQLASLDYQPERESYLREINASEVGHTVMMSRSVWHKVRESTAVSIEGIQDVLQGLQPSGKAIPSRFSWDAANPGQHSRGDDGSGRPLN